MLQDTGKEKRLLGMETVDARHRRPYPKHAIRKFTNAGHVELIPDHPTGRGDDDDRFCRIGRRSQGSEERPGRASVEIIAFAHMAKRLQNCRPYLDRLREPREDRVATLYGGVGGSFVGVQGQDQI
jgi:hypothetical protein